MPQTKARRGFDKTRAASIRSVEWNVKYYIVKTCLMFDEVMYTNNIYNVQLYTHKNTMSKYISVSSANDGCVTCAAKMM